MKTKLLILSILILNLLILHEIIAEEDPNRELTLEDVIPSDCFETDCIVCYLTRSFDEAITQPLIENFSLEEGFGPDFLENDEKGISLFGKDGIISIEFQTEKYKGYLPLIGDANTTKITLKEKYPDNLDEYEKFKFIYESTVLVEVYYSDDYSDGYSHIKEVEYSPLDFIKFYDDCFINGIGSQAAHNEDALLKLSFIPYLEYLLISSGYNFENLDPAKLGYFSSGKAKENVFVLKLYEGVAEHEVDFYFNEFKGVIDAMDMDGKIYLASRGFDIKVKITDQMKILIKELTGVRNIDASEFSFSRPVVAASIYTDYEDNSINLLIHPTDDGKFDLILVVVNG